MPALAGNTIRLSPVRAGGAIRPVVVGGTTYERLSTLVEWFNRYLANPFRNYLLPASWLRVIASRSRSPLIAETFLRPGGWRSMELIYDNAAPQDWSDAQAIRSNPVSVATRNRHRYVVQHLAELIRHVAMKEPVSILGVGAGPGRNIQDAIVASGVNPRRVNAYLIDLADDAFPFGCDRAAKLGIASCVHYLRGDARRIREVLPDVSPQILKLIGLIEYLSDHELRELLHSLYEIMPPGARLVTHGLIDSHGAGPFLRRVFELRHRYRTADDLKMLLGDCGLRVGECFTEPMGIFPIVTAERA